MAHNHRPSSFALEPLEPRTLMSVTALSPLPDLSSVTNQPTTIVDLTQYFDDPAIVGKVVKFDTVMGVFNVELFNVANGSRTAAPLSTAHFLNHVNNNFLPGSTTTRYSSFDNTLVHRVDTSVGVIQGGGFAFPGFAAQTAGPTVNNEYSATRPNTRGTIAFAKQGGNANSATNQWFINIKDNTTVLGPTNNGGFTTFGQVLGDGMTVVDAIAALPTFSKTTLNSAFTQLPLRNTPPDDTGADNVVVVNSIREVSELSFTAESDNPDRVTATIENGKLVLNFSDQTGSAMITLRATDLNGEFMEASFNVNVQQGGALPTVAALKSSATKIARGKTFKLTADGVADGVPGTVSKVEFYRDANGNGMLDPDVDALLGSDNAAASGWTFTVDTAGLPTGSNMFFTRAVDSFGRPSEGAAKEVTITNNAPTLTMIPTLGVGQRNTPTTFSYDVLALFADEADANGDTVLFRIEQVRTGTLTKNGVAVTPGATTVGPGESVVWTPDLNKDGTVETFSFKAFDGELASSRAAVLGYIIDMPPTVRRLSTSPRPLSHPGGTLKLSASAADTDGVVTRVDFYRDSNNNGMLDVGTDQLLGTDLDPRGGWSLTTANTTGFPTGTIRYFARATDDRGAVGAAQTSVGEVNVPPTLGDFTATNPVTRPASLTLTIADVVDAGGKIKKVEFFLDVDNDGVLTSVDRLVAKGKVQPGTNTYAATIGTKDIPAGSTRFIARATDNNNGLTTKNVSTFINPLSANTPPTLDSLTIKPTVANLNQVIKLTANKVKDAEGNVQVVEFYRDSNNNGVFDAATDTRIARDFSSKGGWSATFTIASNATTGAQKFFVRATDLDGSSSEVHELTITINAPPTIASLMAGATTLARGQKLTLTATNVVDTLMGTIKRVEFFRDTNGNNVFDAADKKVGTGKLNGTDYVVSIATKSFSTGTNRFYVRAIDNDNGVSNVPAVNVSLT